MARALIELNDPVALASGILPDVPKNQLALWKDGTNVQFRNGAVEKARGYEAISSADAVITDLAQVYANGVRRVYLGAGPKVLKHEFGTNEDIGIGFNAAGRWQFETYGTFLLATNNIDRPQIWKNTGNLVDWPTAPFLRARLVKKLDNFPMLFAGQEVAWPSYNNIEDFVPGPGKRAGRMFVRDLSSDIVAAEPLGGSLVFYSSDQWGRITFIGGEEAFGIKVLGEGIGAVSPHCIAAVGPLHYGLSRKGFWQADGSSFRYIANEQILEDFLGDMDWDRAEEVRCFHNEAEEQIVWSLPRKFGGTFGLAFKYAKTSWTRIDFGITAAKPQQEFESAIVARGPSWGFFGKGDNLGIEPMVSLLRSFPLSAGSSQVFKRWSNVRLHKEGSGSCKVRFGFGDRQDVVDRWSNPQEIERDNWIDEESVFLTIEVISSGTDISWKMTGFELYGEATGEVP